MRRFLLRLLLAGTPLAAAADPAAESAWQATAQYRFSEAQQLFRALLTAAPDDRLLRFGAAVAALNRPPRTAASIERAAAAFAELAAAHPLDDAGLAARYLLARIDGYHRPGATPGEAAARLRSLADDAPHHPIAQQAAVKLCLLLLYEPRLAPTPAFADAEALVARLTHPAARRDGHLALGRAYLYHRPPDHIRRAYEHLRAADALGLALPATRASVGVSIAELAAELGETDVARHHYRTFLQENPRDARARLVQERLAALAP